MIATRERRVTRWPIGYCKRGEGCWFKHSLPKSAEPVVDEEEEPEPCSICFDTPTTYGLLGGFPSRRRPACD